MNPAARRWLFIMPQDWTWWVWLVTACLLLIGLMGMPKALFAAILLSILSWNSHRNDYGRLAAPNISVPT
jgi:hypothetical protein